METSILQSVRINIKYINFPKVINEMFSIIHVLVTFSLISRVSFEKHFMKFGSWYFQ